MTRSGMDSRVTVRANIDRLVGGAGEETIIARVGEGIVTTVGSSETHKLVLENPDEISKTVLGKGLEAYQQADESCNHDPRRPQSRSQR